MSNAPHDPRPPEYHSSSHYQGKHASPTRNPPVDFPRPWINLVKVALWIGQISSILGAIFTAIAGIVWLFDAQWLRTLVYAPLAFMYQVALAIVFSRVRRWGPPRNKVRQADQATASLHAEGQFVWTIWSERLTLTLGSASPLPRSREPVRIASARALAASIFG